MEKKYKVSAPVGTLVTPSDIMTEAELRKYVPQLVQDPEQHDTWVEKAEKDPIEEVIDWLVRAGFTVEPVEQ